MTEINFTNENSESQTIKINFDFATVKFEDALEDNNFEGQNLPWGDDGEKCSIFGVFEILMHAEKIETPEIAYAMQYPTYEQQKIINHINLTYAKFRDMKVGFGYCFT